MFPGREIAAAWARIGCQLWTEGAGRCRSVPGWDRRAHFGGEMFLWREIAAAWARRGWDGEPRAKGKKKGSIRGGVLPYVGEGRRLLPLDCCAWFW